MSTNINIPQRVNDNVKILGKNVYLFVNAGEGATIAEPNWLLVGGQRNSALEMSADEIDVSDKGSEGWGDTVAGTKTWSIGLESIQVEGDLGAKAIKQAFLLDQEIQIMRWWKNGNAEVGWCSVTEFSDDVPHDDAMSITGTLQGRGAPQFLEDAPYPGGVRDLTVTAGSASATLAWSAVSDALSIKAQYSTNNVSWTDSATTIEPVDNNAEITGLATGTLYYFRLVIIGGNRTGFSNVVSATPV